LLANAVRQRGSSIRIDDFYIEMKGAISVTAILERLQTLNLDGLNRTLVSSKAIGLKFQDAVPENLLASIVNGRALDRDSAERVSMQPINVSAINDSPIETEGSFESGSTL
jgi:threonine synthase